MAEIVAIHGILNEFLGSESLEKDWVPAIVDGLRLAGHRGRPSICCAFYGDLFRPKATKASGPPLLNADDISPGTEEALLAAWWVSASVAEPGVVTPPDSETKVSWPGGAQRAVKALMKSAFFKGFAGRHGQRALIFGLRQVREYIENAQIREEAQVRFRECVGEETRVVVAHSLRSIVAYEVLTSWNCKNRLTFVSLGSPLGMSPIVFDRLRPAPENRFGKLPNVARWWNIADNGDIVAIVKDLRPLFGTGAEIQDTRVNNGWQSHDVLRYLRARETGEAIASGF